MVRSRRLFSFEPSQFLGEVGTNELKVEEEFNVGQVVEFV
jgi:hypothetical protein